MAPRPAARPPLTRAQIVDAAVALADERGFEALSMRAVARSVGVEAMSLYHHVANKEALLDAMVDVVFAEVDAPQVDDPGGWAAALRARCTSMRRALVRHPWALGRLDSRRTPGPATLDHHEAVIACLRAGGFDVAAAARAFATVDAFVYGFVLQELSLPMGSGEPVTEVVDEIVSHLDPTTHPGLVEMANLHVRRPGYAFGDEFEPGLDLVLASLATLRTAHR